MGTMVHGTCDCRVYYGYYSAGPLRLQGCTGCGKLFPGGRAPGNPGPVGPTGPCGDLGESPGTPGATMATED